MTPTWRSRYLPVGVIFFRREFIVEHRRYAPPQTLPARFRLIFTMPLFAGAMSGGCLTVDRPVATLVSEATRTSPPAITVRAQSDEPAAGVVPPNAAPNPSSNPTGVLPEGFAPEEPGDPPAPPSTSATPEVVIGVLDTALESLFGEASTSDWTPLSFATLFTEGWNRPFVFSPASDSGALRQEWINAANGVFYRQWVLDYNFRDHATPSGNRDIGTWSIFAPLSRRLELYISIPFVDYHAVDYSSASSGGRARFEPTSRGPGCVIFGDLRRHHRHAAGAAE